MELFDDMWNNKDIFRDSYLFEEMCHHFLFRSGVFPMGRFGLC